MQFDWLCALMLTGRFTSDTRQEQVCSVQVELY